MRKYVVILLSLISMVLIVTAVFASIRRSTPGMQVRFNKRDFPERGVHIITPLDPSFDAQALKHFKNKPPEGLKPFSIFIHNSGSKMVLAYALTWKFVRQDGQVITKTVGYSEPGLLMGDEIPTGPGFRHTTAIESDTAKCFTWDSQIEPDSAEASNKRMGSSISSVMGGKGSINVQTDATRLRELLSAQLSEATDLTVSLDGVVFEDGVFVGSNLLFFQQLEASVNAKVDLLRQLGQGVEEGRIDQVLESIETASREPDVKFSQEFSADDYYRYFKKLYAIEISGKTRAFGKEKTLPRFLKSYRQARPILRRE
jgi:hypothetical protein